MSIVLDFYHLRMEERKEGSILLDGSRAQFLRVHPVTYLGKMKRLGVGWRDIQTVVVPLGYNLLEPLLDQIAADRGLLFLRVACPIGGELTTWTVIPQADEPFLQMPEVALPWVAYEPGFSLVMSADKARPYVALGKYLLQYEMAIEIGRLPAVHRMTEKYLFR